MQMHKNIKQIAGAVDTWVITPVVRLLNKKQHGGEVENPHEIIRQGMLVIVLFFGGLLVWGIFGHIKLFNGHLRRFSRFCCIINLTCKSIDEIFLGMLNTPIISVKIKFFIQGKAICCFIKVYF